jgi:hypothetical protein
MSYLIDVIGTMVVGYDHHYHGTGEGTPYPRVDGADDVADVDDGVHDNTPYWYGCGRGTNLIPHLTSILRA